MKIPEYLEPFCNGDLVDYRRCPSIHNPLEIYQIHDKTLHHICYTATDWAARLIVDSINLAYKISKVHGEDKADPKTTIYKTNGLINECGHFGTISPTPDKTGRSQCVECAKK